jgi:hypothetical protein
MAKDKQSFVLYSDLLYTVEKLIQRDRERGTNESGELFYHILQYVNDLSPDPISDMVDISFEPIKRQLKRDLIKYEKKKEQWSNAGKASAESRKKKKEQNPTDVDNRSTDSTVSVNDSVTVTVNDTVINKISFVDFWDIYDKKVGDREKIEKKWDSLSLKIQEEIMKYIPVYVQSQPDKKFRKNPQTFLNNKSWKDEIIEESTREDRAKGSGKNRIGTDFSESL